MVLHGLLPACPLRPDLIIRQPGPEVGSDGKAICW
jgi:hypothetical protein